MKKVILPIFFILVFFILDPCSSLPPVDNTFEVKLRQDNQIIDVLQGSCAISDNKFEILITNKNKRDINIFAYHSDEMFTKYSYPIKCDKTVIFHPATFIIDNADENKEITLTINREMQYNVITPDKRIDDNGMSIIKIKDIADTDDKFDGVLYLTIFIDQNNNKRIEDSEIKNITIAINKSRNTTLFKAKIHISTMGGWLRDINYPVFSNDYFFVKISNEEEKRRFFELFGQNYGDATYSTTNRIRDTDYSRNNMYILFSPITTEIELYNNPYRYSGENKLIFDTRINHNSNRGKYVFYREYRVEKNKDLYEIWININGILKRPRELKLQ